jgi:hypothetical protein
MNGELVLLLQQQLGVDHDRCWTLQPTAWGSQPTGTGSLCFGARPGL